jgi:ubiquinone/menaquinone biosynthesis C-methylase UbiE
MTTRYESRRYALMNRWNPRNLSAVLELVEPKAGAKVLDVGCGRGHLVGALQQRGIDAYGVDLNPAAAEVAVAANVRTMPAEHLSFGDAFFEAVVSFHAIEHIPAVEAAIAEMARVVRVGGRVLLIYPAEPVRGLYAIPTSIILHGTPFKARRVHIHKLRPSLVGRMAASAGLTHVHSRFRAWPSPEWVSVFVRQG